MKTPLASKSRQKRAGVVIASVASVAIALSGCAGNGGSAADNTVTFFSWANQEVMQPVLDEFESETGIQVEFSYAPPIDDYVNTLQTRLSSGTAADVFVMASENKNQLIASSAAADISDLPNVARAVEKARILYGGEDGSVFAASPGAWAGGIFYNKDLLAQVGYDSVPNDWTEFMDLCAKLADAGINPLIERGDEPSIILAALLGEVNEQFNGEMDKQIWDGEASFAETWTEPLTKLDSLIDAGYMSANVVGLNLDNAIAAFVAGEAAMLPTGSWSLTPITEGAPGFDLGFGPVPTEEGGYWGGTISTGYAVNAEAKNPEGAEKLVDFLMSDEALRIYQDATSQIITVDGFENELPATLDKGVEAAAAGTIYWPQTWWVDNNQALLTHVVAVTQEMIQGKRTAEATASSIDEKLASLR